MVNLASGSNRQAKTGLRSILVPYFEDMETVLDVDGAVQWIGNFIRPLRLLYVYSRYQPANLHYKNTKPRICT